SGYCSRFSAAQPAVRWIALASGMRKSPRGVADPFLLWTEDHGSRSVSRRSSRGLALSVPGRDYIRLGCGDDFKRQAGRIPRRRSASKLLPSHWEIKDQRYVEGHGGRWMVHP